MTLHSMEEVLSKNQKVKKYFLIFSRILDDEKKLLCKSEGITLIEVPYWWDGTKESLLGTITSQRPELLSNSRFANSKTEINSFKPIPEKTHFKVPNLRGIST